MGDEDFNFDDGGFDDAFADSAAEQSNSGDFNADFVDEFTDPLGLESSMSAEDTTDFDAQGDGFGEKDDVFGTSDDDFSADAFADFGDSSSSEEKSSDSSGFSEDDLKFDESDDFEFNTPENIEVPVLNDNFGRSEFARDGVNADEDFSDMFGRKKDDDGVPRVDMSGMDRLVDSGDLTCVAVASGNQLVYVAHGSEGRLGFLIKFLGAALGGRLVRFKLGDEDIETLKNNPVAFNEEFKKYLEVE